MYALRPDHPNVDDDDRHAKERGWGKDALEERGLKLAKKGTRLPCCPALAQTVRSFSLIDSPVR